MKETRKHYSPKEKVAILRRHLLEQVPLSELCEEHQIQPSQFYQWQKQFFEKGAMALERSSSWKVVVGQRLYLELKGAHDGTLGTQED